jgi:Dyp-type peroxidase family
MTSGAKSEIKSRFEQADSQDLSGKQGLDRMTDLYLLMQRGLVYPSPFARFVLFWKKPDTRITRAVIRDVMLRTRKEIHRNFGSRNTSAVVGVSFDLFKEWCDEDGMSYPAGMNYLHPIEDVAEKRETSDVFERSSSTFRDSGATLWFHIKSDDVTHCAAVYDFIARQLKDYIDPRRAFYQDCNRRVTLESADGKVLGCRFSENLNNPADPVTIAQHTLVSSEDVDHAGASYVLAQRFVINWEQLHSMTEEQIEDIIGRTTDDIILPSRDTRSHIKCARVRDERGDTQFVMRLGLPFGRSKSLANPDLVRKGSNLRDEEGIFFAGFAKNVQVLESIMDNQIGDDPSFMNDRLLNHVKSTIGGFFYVPSRADLGLDLANWEGLAKRDWDRFPGVNWSLLSRHFKDQSPNGRMYYNHKNYLYNMSTMNRKEAALVDPPSTRILTLLMRCFARWQDTWYFEKDQPEMQHLCAYIARDFGEKKAKEVMGLPIMERKGWATRMTCRLYATDDYGYHGTRIVDDVKQTGADTFRIDPMEIIVGAMPDLSLGQGRYVMKYLLPHEEMPSFFRGLTEASGVGHILPDHQKLVDNGLGKLIETIRKKLDKADDGRRQSFYRACILSLEGVQDHLKSFSELAEKMAAETTIGESAEKANLLEIAKRTRKLVTDKPETMVEAAQLIFSVHSCLHMNGEPVSIGRLDQYLDRFCEADIKKGRLTEDQAQEIIDALWIKLDEKVLQNRIFIKDHQPYGNLAMGGASGPYPQGASLGQWIMQVTVGGVVGNDDRKPKLAYNRVTKLCLRSSARLPLNAPCLSLRMRKDMPRDILEEAAKAILSGGAHPIFLNDDKIIPGLAACGDGVGDGRPDDNNPYTPVRKKAEGRWNSQVALASARNYGCDGCYEPMFVGQNWFTLGGFTTLNPLECALNQGRLYASAGPAYLEGQNLSFRSRPAAEIKSFDELLELYFEHFYWLCAKALDGQLSTFDTLASVCPAPLLSVLTDDCIEKGLDLYEGGARYNVYGPCFIGLSSTINSLYAIKKMVFDEETAVTSLPELLQCLMCDWGNKMVEPFVSVLIGPVRTAGQAERWKRLRKFALSLPRYGRGHAEIDELGNKVVARIADLTVKVFREPAASTAQKMLNYANLYGTKKQPFGFQIQPGAGTFENFIEFGKGSGASADGRRLGESIASDLSAAPSSMDMPPDPKYASFSKSLAGFSGEGAAKIWDGAPTDFNIAEDFPQDALVRILNEFADGQGSNILTITCASPATFAEAPNSPEKFDLLRARMGGWTEFFTSMFPESQQQHQHRPLSTPEKSDA